MKSKHQLFFVLFLICILFFSCEQPNNEIPVQEYSTPTIKGTISLPSGSTVNPADIYVKVIDSTGATAKVQKANSDKTFVVQGLNADMSYSILFSSVEPEFTNRAISRDPDKSNGVGGWIHDVKPIIKEGNDIGSVKLKPLGTIRGKALIDGKAEHYDTTVYIPGTSYIAMTNADGTFAIYNVPEGNYTLRYTHDGYMSIMNEGVILTCPEDAENPEITTRDVKLVSSSGTVEGVALYDGLTSHSGITIKLESEDRTKAAQASTSEDGSYVFNDVAPGVYRVIVSASGYVSMSSGYFTVESATLTSVPERTVLYRNVGSVKGTVKLSDSQADSSGIVVSFVSNEDSFTAVTDKDGYFSRNLKPGSYTVTASYPGYTSQSLDVTVTENALTEINLPSLPLASGAVAGFVVLSGSEDFSGVVITLTNSAAMTESYTAVTAADGSFRFTGLNKGGTYLLTYSKDGYVSDNSKSIDVTVGSVANAGAVTLKSTYSTVKGSIQLEGASSYENVTILLKNDNNQYTSTTDQKGMYVINRVLPGTYTLLASKDGYVTNSPVEVVVSPSSEISVSVQTLSVAIRSVTGSVELELKTDHSGVLITATKLNDSTKVYSAISNSEGNYTLAGMEPGEYQIVISSNGYRTATLPTVDIISNSTTDLSKKFIEINRGTIQGQVTLEGRTSSAGVKVELMQGSEVYETKYTDEAGSYLFYVPQGNYSGVLFSREDFNPDVDYTGIALFSDQYVSVTSKQLKATHNSISGIVDVYTGQEDVENSNVHVTIDGHNEYGEIITSADGRFTFEHLPLGNYTIRINRQNCSDYTINVSLAATNPVDLGVLRIFSNTGTVQGTVTLNKYTDPSGVNVFVEVDGKTLSTVTNSLGRYEIGGIPAFKSFTIKYEKEGWKSETVSITNALESLEVRDLGGITLIDNIAPTINSVLINNGANSTGSRQVTIDINAFDYGCGIELMQYSWSENFDLSEWLNYNSNKQIEIPDRENGKKILMVRLKDKSGNVSEIYYANINLVDQVKTYYGTLRGEDLHWKKENSPIIVSDDITVAAGTTLVIDPGVDVFFDGPYSINVKGTLKAIGTESNNIHFDSSRDYVKDILKKDGYYGCWNGIELSDNPIDYNYDGVDISYISGSIISNAEILNMKEGISGSIIIKDSYIVSEKVYFCNNFSQPYSLVLFRNNITGTVYITSISEKGLISGNHFSGNNDLDSILLMWFDESNYLNFFNNHVSDYSRVQLSTFYFHSNTVENCNSVLIENLCSSFCNNFLNNKEEISIGVNDIPKCVLNNFIGNSGYYVISSDASLVDDHRSLNCQFNYWGPAYTNVLREAEYYGQENISFIFDYNDKDYDIHEIWVIPEINWANYLVTELDSIGYQGTDYVDFIPVCTNCINPDSYYKVLKEGDDVKFTLSLLTDGAIKKYRVSQTMEGLLNEDWKTYDGECVFENNRIDVEQLNGNELTLLIQCMTDSGATPIRFLSLICLAPYIQECNFESYSVVTSNDPFYITFIMDNYSNMRYYNIEKICYIDDSRLDDPERSGNINYKLTINPSSYEDGKHTLRIVLIDEVNNTSETVIPFTIRRSKSST